MKLLIRSSDHITHNLPPVAYIFNAELFGRRSFVGYFLNQCMNLAFSMTT